MQTPGNRTVTVAKSRIAQNAGPGVLSEIAWLPQRIGGVELSAMMPFLKRARWAVLWRCARLVIRLCRVFHIRLSNDSFWRPHRLARFRPHYVPARVVVGVQLSAR